MFQRIIVKYLLHYRYFLIKWRAFSCGTAGTLAKGRNANVRIKANRNLMLHVASIILSSPLYLLLLRSLPSGSFRVPQFISMPIIVMLS
jgi:hypothetical protein